MGSKRSFKKSFIPYSGRAQFGARLRWWKRLPEYPLLRFYTLAPVCARQECGTRLFVRERLLRRLKTRLLTISRLFTTYTEKTGFQRFVQMPECKFRKKLGGAWPDHNFKMAVNSCRLYARFPFIYFAWKHWTTFQDVAFMSKIFRSVEPKLSYQLLWNQNFWNFVLDKW